MHWVIQDKVFGDETAELIKYAKSYQIAPDCGVYGFGADDPYIVRGTIEFVKETYGRWDEFSNMPKLLTLKNYTCSKYYQKVPNLLNQDFFILPWWKLKKCKHELFNYFDTDEGINRLFIRPNSGKKLFTGTTVGPIWFEKEFDIIKALPSSNFTEDTLVVVAKQQKIWSERRFVMHENTIITSAVYGDYSQADDGPEVYSDLVKSNTYYPDDFYTIDVCMTENGPKIVELNSMVCAGLYDCDYEKVVKSVETYYTR